MNLNNIPFGELEAFNVVVETPKGSTEKYAYEPELGAIKVSRVLYDGLAFPFNYGFVARTETYDGGFLDAFVISTHPITTGTIVTCRAVGMLEFMDEGKQDHKIIAVPLSDERLNNLQEIGDLSASDKELVASFYSQAAKQWSRDMQIQGFADKSKAKKELLRTQILD